MKAPQAPLGFLSSPYHRGGVTRWMVDMAAAWRRAGADALFVVPHPKVPFANACGQPAICDLLYGMRDDERPAVVSRQVDSRFEFGTQRHRAHTYAEMVRQNLPAGVPIIVSDDAAVWAAAASVADRNPLIGVLHADGDNYYALAATYATSASVLVCVSRRIEQELRRRLGATGVDTAVVPCGTPLPGIKAKRTPNASLRLAWVGRLEEVQKRVSDLAKIASGLQASATPFHLDIVGDGPERGAVENTIQLARLSEYVRFHGWLDRSAAQEVMLSADVLLLPSNFEGMPIVVMEALALGCGVVASRVSGVEDLEYHPLAASCLLLHDVGDVSAAVRLALQLWRSDPDQRTRAARGLAKAEMSIEVCMERYVPIVARSAAAPILQSAPIGVAAWSELASLAVSTQRRARVWMKRRLSAESSTRPR